MGYGDEMEVGREGLEGVFFYRINTMDRIYRRDGIFGGARDGSGLLGLLVFSL